MPQAAKRTTAATKKVPAPQKSPARPAAQAARPTQHAKPGPATRASVPATTGRARPPADPATLSNLPAFMRQDAGLGKENIGREDLEIPRLKLMQGLSPELETYDGLRPGYFFHTASEFIFDRAFRAVPLFMTREYILWNPRDSGGGILARATDGVHWSPSSGEFKVKLDKKDGGDEVVWRLAKTVQQSGLANWGTMNPKDTGSPPAATLMYNYVLAFPDEPDLMPAVLTFQRSSVKMGRKLNTKLAAVRTPLFGCIFEFSAIDDTNSRGQDFKNVQATAAGTVEDEAMYNAFKDLHMGFRERGLAIKDIEGLQGADGDTEAGDDGGKGRPGY